MHLITSKRDLRESPDLREPNSEALHAAPAHHAAAIRTRMPIGTTITEIRRIDYLDDINDRCTALLIGLGEHGHFRLILNELGEDTRDEMAAAGRALAAELRIPYVEGEPAGWPQKRVSFLARLFGYAA